MLPDALFLNVHMYGIMIAVGVLFTFIVLHLYCRKCGIEQKFEDFLFYNGVASIAVGFGAAALFQAFYNYLKNPSAGFRLGSGITFIGGLIGGAACFLILYLVFRKKYSNNFFDVSSIIPCCILIAHGFGRIGCFFAGCCYGKPTDSFLGVKFPDLAEKVHPTQLYEAAFLFLMFAVCSYLLLKKKFTQNLALYFISYGVFRFLIEFIRGDERGAFIGALSPSQFWSILMIVAGVGCIFLQKKFGRKPDAAPAAEPSEEQPGQNESNE